MTNYTISPAVGALALATRGLQTTASASVADGFSVSSTASFAFQPGGLLNEGVRLGDVFTPTALYHLLMAEGATITPRHTVSFGVKLSDGVGLTSLLSALRAVLVLEGLKLSDAVLPSGRFGRALLERIGLNDALAKFFAASLNEGVFVGTTMTSSLIMNQVLADGIRLADTLTPRLILSATMAEGVKLTDAQLLQGIYSGTLREGIVVKALYMAPAGDMLTWVVNTRTGAVTEYRNYAFRSFAQIGDRYIAASDTGLYEMVGNTDSGTNITARMKGGILAVNGMRYTGLKGVYLGMRVHDEAREFFLKLHAGDGREYVYAFSPRNMRTTKINIGKGLRSRYFQWELVTTAADWDLDNIEFVPMLSSRRM